MKSSESGADVVLRQPRLEDGKAVHELIGRCPPLDLNSSYNYFLLCSHFAETCVVAEVDGQIQGFLSGYLIPGRPDTYFLWQVAIDSSLRGQGMASKLLNEALGRGVCNAVNYLETTVSPSNKASRRVFESFAEKANYGWHEEVFLDESHFGAESHESEVLFRIGPFNK